MYETENPLLRALGIPIPPGTNEEEACKKILHDSYVQVKVLELLVSRYAPEAIASKMLLSEREALATRGGIQPPIQKPKIEWAIVMPEATTNGKMLITATSGAETIRWNGAVRDLRTLKFRGESVPADVAQVYEMHYGTGNDADIAAAGRDWGAYHDAVRKQNDFENKQKSVPQY